MGWNQGRKMQVPRIGALARKGSETGSTLLSLLLRPYKLKKRHTLGPASTKRAFLLAQVPFELQEPYLDDALLKD